MSNCVFLTVSTPPITRSDIGAAGIRNGDELHDLAEYSVGIFYGETVYSGHPIPIFGSGSGSDHRPTRLDGLYTNYDSQVLR